MHLVTFQFQTPQDLSSFRKKVEGSTFEINIRELTLLCRCSKEHLDLAITNFRATVLKTHAV